MSKFEKKQMNSQHLKQKDHHGQTHIESNNPYLKMCKYHGNNLHLIVDLNTQYWLETQSFGITNLLVLVSQIMNTHFLKNIHNSVSVILMNSRDSKLIFPRNDLSASSTNSKIRESADQERVDNLDYKEIQRRIEQRVLEFMSNTMADNLNYSREIPAITQALCRINKHQLELERKSESQISHEKYFYSIIVLQVSEIHSSMYNPLMSCVETAIKNKVIIYGYPLPQSNLSSSTQKYLTQLCSLTHGYYFNQKQKKDDKPFQLNPFDMMNYFSILMLTSGDMMANPEISHQNSSLFRQGINEDLEFRVNCTCHNTPIEGDKAFVCSDCLFLYCKDDNPCHSCDSVKSSSS